MVTTSCIFPGVRSRSYLAVIQYDGGGFAGWQRQPVDRTVQAEFEAGLEGLVGRRNGGMGAGRTDAGGQALGPGVGFFATQRLGAPPPRLGPAFKSLIPPGVFGSR